MASKSGNPFRSTNYSARKTGLPKLALLIVGALVVIVLAVLTHHHQPVKVARGPLQRLYSPLTVDPSAIVENLKAGKFNLVESTLKSFEQATAKDPRAEMNLVYGFGAFASSDDAIGVKVREWAAAWPDSANAHCARAVVLVEAASHARGRDGGPISSLPPDRFMDMEKDLNQAVMEADSARGLDPGLINAYLPAIEAARMEMDPVTMEEASKRAFDKFPASFQARRAAITAMEPRWGGSYDAMDKFANESQAYVSMNPMLHYLLGFPAMAQAQDLQAAEKWEPAISLLDHAIELGGDYPAFYTYRGNSNYGLKNYDQALVDYKSANELTPDDPENLQMLALTAHELNRATDALSYANRYLKLEDPNKEVADVHEWALSQVLKN